MICCGGECGAVLRRAEKGGRACRVARLYQRWPRLRAADIGESRLALAAALRGLAEGNGAACGAGQVIG